MDRKPVDYARVASRFRFFAELCRQRAEKFPASAEEFEAQARRWDRDAEQVERDGKIIADSIEFLARIDAQIGRRAVD